MSIKTLADVAVVATEQAIDSHLTASLLISDKPVNAANVRAAIRRLREALKPFIRGWVDDETADITDFADLDVKLEVRDRQIAQLRLPSAQREAVAALCGVIVNVVYAIEKTKCFIVILPSANTRMPGQVPLQLFLAARSSANLHL